MKKTLIALLILSGSIVKAEPWLDTRDAWLRADIEALSAHGVINTPITTWPLPWARIVKDIDNVELDQVPESLVPALMRVKRKARIETSTDTRSELSLKAGNEGKVLRHFGDDRREKAEITSSNKGMTKSFAWNIEATKAFSPFDGEEERLDHSYVAGIWGNWIFSAGAQERWYGPGWDSSLILSNNARPVPSLSIKRNYADPFESDWLSWIGPWSVSAFAGQLESDRFIPHAKLIGMSVTFKPLDSLEIGLRRTAQWGGEGRPESLSSLVDLAIGRTNCDQIADGCDDRLNSGEAGNQIAGIDFDWRLPTETYHGSIYGQLIGEDEAGYAPSRKFFQIGYKNNFTLGGDTLVTSFIEYADTENEYAKNVTYEHGIYRTGYRTEGRSIGSTYDADSESLTFGMLASTTSGSRYKVSVSKVDMNKGGVGDNHTIATNELNFNRLSLKYQKPFKHGLLSASIDYQDKAFEISGVNTDKYNVGLSWTMEL
ncbi:capsule assembly Wzi family protein [Kangiella spongicola]|uniref:Capsule assembly Wzi family protein n=1 Tax=Kangiella spongicola TaxID=796379 RepID=A0A318D1F2_9GAMM|nr:capsule assembly Wzi family protein [Kangiella spongicola]PXF63046.1 capsule assembly Wzi family protein [Kangiella spongicola]